MLFANPRRQVFSVEAHIIPLFYSTVHRIGRTGRCGKTGLATTFINKAVGKLASDIRHWHIFMLTVSMIVGVGIVFCLVVCMQQTLKLAFTFELLALEL